MKNNLLNSFSIIKNSKFFILLIFISANSFSLYGIDRPIAPTVKDSLQKVHDSWDRFSLSTGVFFSNYSSGISIGSKKIGLGVHVDIENILGLETSTTAFKGNANYRFGKSMRHVISFGYFGIYRNSYKVLKKELEIGEIVFPIGVEIRSKFDLTIFRIKYDYSFLHNKNVSLGASFGLFIMPISFSVKTLNFEEQAAQFIAPLPVLGLRTDFMIVKNISLHQSVELLLLSFENFQGRILDVDLSLEHQIFKYASYGIGVNSNSLTISAKGKDNSSIEFFGELEMEYAGVYLFIKYRI